MVLTKSDFRMKDLRENEVKTGGFVLMSNPFFSLNTFYEVLEYAPISSQGKMT